MDYQPFYGQEEYLHRPLAAGKILLKNGTIWTATGQVFANHDILLENGKISQIGANIVSPGAQTFELNGKYVTPGIVDMHSHVGVYPYPEGTQTIPL